MFILTSNPTPVVFGKKDESYWESFTSSGQYFVINTTSYMDFSQEYKERMDFWRSVCGVEGCNFGSAKK